MKFGLPRGLLGLDSGDSAESAPSQVKQWIGWPLDRSRNEEGPSSSHSAESERNGWVFEPW